MSLEISLHRKETGSVQRNSEFGFGVNTLVSVKTIFKASTTQGGERRGLCVQGEFDAEWGGVRGRAEMLIASAPAPEALRRASMQV